jgi:hypothetical protein
MALHLYRRHRLFCEGGHAEDSCSSELDERRKGWRRCLLRASRGHHSPRVLDFLIPLTERHLRSIMSRWVTHDNRGRPHSRLGPGLPEPPVGGAVEWWKVTNCPTNVESSRKRSWGGLHHEYRLESAA